MKVFIETELCSACRLCYEILPSVFADRGDGIPIVITSAVEKVDILELEDVAYRCPSSCIIIS
ncbi:MAG: ferredoxin [Aquificaceae bacterium]